MTYRRIIFDYLRALGITHKAYNAMKEEYDLPDISNDELCTITTGRLISLARGETIPEEAFSDMRPVAKPNGTSQKELDNTPDQEWGDDSGEDKPTEPKKAAASWKSFVHPKRKVKLGDMDEADQLKLARWGLTLGDEPDLDEDAMPFYKSVMDMAKDRKWDSPNACLIASLGASTEYSEEKFLDEDVLSRFGLSNMDDMPEEDAAEFIGDFDAVLESIVEIGEKRMKARAKGKKKPAVSVPD